MPNMPASSSSAAALYDFVQRIANYDHYITVANVEDDATAKLIVLNAIEVEARALLSTAQMKPEVLHLWALAQRQALDDGYQRVVADHGRVTRLVAPRGRFEQTEWFVPWFWRRHENGDSLPGPKIDSFTQASMLLVSDTEREAFDMRTDTYAVVIASYGQHLTLTQVTKERFEQLKPPS